MIWNFALHHQCCHHLVPDNNSEPELWRIQRGQPSPALVQFRRCNKFDRLKEAIFALKSPEDRAF